jgi:hypothetical protein
VEICHIFGSPKISNRVKTNGSMLEKTADVKTKKFDSERIAVVE